LIPLLLALSWSAQAQFTNYLWTGATSSNWSTGSNWSGGSSPGSGTSMMFNRVGANQSIDITAAATPIRGPYFYGGNYTFGNQTMLMYSATGPNQLSSGTVTFNSGLTTAGNIVFQGTGSGDIFLNGVSGNSTAGGAFSLQKYNTSNLTITNTFTSNSTAAQVIRAGALILSGNGVFTLSNSTNTISLGDKAYYGLGLMHDTSGAAIILDNTGTNNTNRITNDHQINIAQRGLIELRGNSSATSSETLGVLNAAGSGALIRVKSGSGQLATLTFSNLLINSNPTSSDTLNAPTMLQFLVPTGDTLGVSGTTGGRVMITNYTSANLTNGVLRYGVVKNEGGAATFATYDATLGVQGLSTWTDTNLNNSTSTSSINATGSITLSAAKQVSSLRINADGAGQSLNLGGSTGNLTFSGARGFVFNGNGYSDYTITGGNATYGVSTGPGTYFYINSDKLTISSIFRKSNDFSKAGDGLLVLSGDVYLANNSYLSVDKGSSGGYDMEISGPIISGSNVQTKTGLGVLALTGAGDNGNWGGSGGTGLAIAAGTVVLNKNSEYLQSRALGTGNFTLIGGTLDVRNYNATITIPTVTISRTNPSEITGNASVEFTKGVRGDGTGTTVGTYPILVNNITSDKTLTLSGNISSSGSAVSQFEISGSGRTVISGTLENTGTGTTALTKSGTGSLTLSGSNTYTGPTRVYGGYLRLDNANALSTDVLEISTKAYSVNVSTGEVANAVVELGTGYTSFTRISGNATGNVNLGGFSGGDINNAGFASVSGTATVNLGGSGTALTWGSVGFFLNGGNLVLGSPNVAGTVDFQNAINLVGNRTITALNGTADVDGIISGVIANGNGTRSLTKDGAGTLALTAANTYSGSTNVTAGTLLVNGNQTAANGAVAVASGATLGGNGTLGGATAVTGIVSPGTTGIDTLNIANSVTWNGAATAGSATDWIFQLGAANTADLLNITGAFTKGSGSVFRFDFAGTGSTGTFKLVDWTTSSSFSASEFSFTNLASGLTGSFTMNGTQLEFNALGAVPEPSTWIAMAALSLAGATILLRRKVHS